MMNDQAGMVLRIIRMMISNDIEPNDIMMLLLLG